MHPRIASVGYCLFVLAMLVASTAQAQERVALVIGNGAYQSASRLPNPSNDAADMASALRALDFTVVVATDVDKGAFDRKLREFAHALRTARTAVFFYAGHGIQVAGKNYAIPVDAKLETAADLQVETVDIDQIVAVMQSDENRVNLVFLDACRDNPLTRSFARGLPATRAASVGAGLSALEAGRGTLIAFSTAPNTLKSHVAMSVFGTGPKCRSGHRSGAVRVWPGGMRDASTPSGTRLPLNKNAIDRV